MKILSWDVGIYNLSYCILERKTGESIIKIVDWDIVNLVDNELMKKNRSLLFENIPRKLQERPQLLDVDLVVIENQPSLKNPQMKSIQMILYSYFLILGKIVGCGEKGDKSIGYIDKIEFCSASNKLKIYDGPPIILEEICKKLPKKVKPPKKNSKINLVEVETNQDDNILDVKKEELETDIILDEDISNIDNIEEQNMTKKKKSTLAYKDKKKLAIEHAKYFVLKNNPSYIDFFNNNKKKDDLADSYLQGLYWFKNIK
jgi:hypothetical protein